jgi:hypothetical protein
VAAGVGERAKEAVLVPQGDDRLAGHLAAPLPLEHRGVQVPRGGERRRPREVAFEAEAVVHRQKPQSGRMRSF